MAVHAGRAVYDTGVSVRVCADGVTWTRKK